MLVNLTKGKGKKGNGTGAGRKWDHGKKKRERKEEEKGNFFFLVTDLIVFKWENVPYMYCMYICILLGVKPMQGVGGDRDGDGRKKSNKKR